MRPDPTGRPRTGCAPRCRPRGEVTLGFQHLSELIHVEGIDIAGPLPPAIQIETVFAAAVGARSALAEDAARCIGFMASTEADDAKRRQGMAPA